MVSKQIFEDYKKQLIDPLYHLDVFLNKISKVIDTWSSEQLRSELLRKIGFFREKGYSDPFHPCIDRNLVVKSLRKKGLLNKKKE